MKKGRSVTDNENGKKVAEVSIDFPDDNLIKVDDLLKKCFLEKFTVVLNLRFRKICHFVEIILRILYIKDLLGIF